MTISTKCGWKIIRKLDNIINKEHLSAKILQLNPYSYHNDLLVSAKHWLGKVPNILSEYYEKIHEYTEGA